MQSQPEISQVSDVLIIGGGLAGLCSSIHLSAQGLSVVLIEKEAYPRHKVCGEYVSNEILPYLSYLGIDPFDLGAVRISELEFSGPDGASLRSKLPLGGFGISRFRLDHALAEKAIEKGVTLIQDQVDKVTFQNDQFSIRTKKSGSYQCQFAIGAFGKRSVLDKKLDRQFIQKKSSYVAVKSHYQGDFPEHLVGLHNFEGGYCGVSRVEEGRLNICYLANYDVFQKYKDPEVFEREVIRQNPQLASVLSNAEMIFHKPLTISQISFDSKELVVNHMLMCGDSAGLIHPLCGNGMGMAIGAAQLASDAILSYFNGKFKSRAEVEKQYIQQWKKRFSSRLRTGHFLALLLRKYRLTYFLVPVLRKFPWMLRGIIRNTHGKPSLAL